ncbi:hypothetical protein TREMEDRAFT_66475 [Tremella mesenterica DSM 1558]|uniref:uncharacterized protein n=1 Tax=Tremella mesenterica (strain ATCC 24925 / CBS 8224 / DSM 1558 / NBRC 9311 / NRRL Y-6157 / RJB 2259-6 / UBC 559-6) TaxID=578456 RepID=UPI00032C7A0F|nr:uncharacterized protein TREMEDRAFT_66475 [Tremella mesenterica DSM 1558]EIW65561.1 hypothetical protein TREMEDRAFT_66475 [Tremella mesenterica DSM 1558]
MSRGGTLWLINAVVGLTPFLSRTEESSHGYFGRYLGFDLVSASQYYCQILGDTFFAQMIWDRETTSAIRELNYEILSLQSIRPYSLLKDFHRLERWLWRKYQVLRCEDQVKLDRLMEKNEALTLSLTRERQRIKDLCSEFESFLSDQDRLRQALVKLSKHLTENIKPNPHNTKLPSSSSASSSSSSPSSNHVPISNSNSIESLSPVKNPQF